MSRLPLTLLAASLLAGCAQFDIKRMPDYHKFDICYGYTCAQHAETGLSKAQWAKVRAIFRPAPKTPAEERKRIALAVGEMERIVGPMTGTAHDLPMDLAGLGKPGQMDCIDEATNTTAYLAMMEKDGLFRFHKVTGPAQRGFFFLFGWPHSTAAVIDTTTGKKYAVDSWFGANGDPAFVVPMRTWLGGWRPKGYEESIL